MRSFSLDDPDHGWLNRPTWALVGWLHADRYHYLMEVSAACWIGAADTGTSGIAIGGEPSGDSADRRPGGFHESRPVLRCSSNDWTGRPKRCDHPRPAAEGRHPRHVVTTTCSRPHWWCWRLMPATAPVGRVQFLVDDVDKISWPKDGPVRCAPSNPHWFCGDFHARSLPVDLLSRRRYSLNCVRH